MFYRLKLYTAIVILYHPRDSLLLAPVYKYLNYFLFIHLTRFINTIHLFTIHFYLFMEKNMFYHKKEKERKTKD